MGESISSATKSTCSDPKLVHRNGDDQPVGPFFLLKTSIDLICIRNRAVTLPAPRSSMFAPSPNTARQVG